MPGKKSFVHFGRSCIVISPYFLRSAIVSSLGVPRPYVLNRCRWGQHVIASRDIFSGSVNWRATEL
jgi:hypothetical protein